MLAGVFSIEGLEDDSEAHEKAWNEWVALLATDGLRPGDEPISSSDTEARFELELHERIDGEKVAVTT